MLLHLVVAERLARLEADQHRARLVARVEDDGRRAAARRLDLAQVPVLHESDSNRRRLDSRRAARRRPIPLGADRDELLRRRASAARREAVVVDPGGDAARAPARARAHRRPLRRDPGHAHPLGPPRRRRRPRRGDAARRSTCPRASAACSSSPLAPAGIRPRPTTPDVLARPAARRSRSPASRSRSVAFPATRPATSPTPPTAPLLGRRALRRLGRPHRPPRRRLGHAARVDPAARRALPARDRRLLRPRPADDARRRARAQPVPRRAPRRAARVKFEAPRGTHDILPSEQPLWRRVDAARSRTVRALRLPADPDAGLRGHRASSSARRAQGSDVVQKEMYTFTDRGGRSLTLRPEGTAPIVPRVPRARPAPRAAAGEALHDRADVPLRRAAEGPLPRALAALRRGDRLGRPGGRRRDHPAVRRRCSAGSA